MLDLSERQAVSFLSHLGNLDAKESRVELG